jgi:hypothetical protein
MERFSKKKCKHMIFDVIVRVFITDINGEKLENQNYLNGKTLIESIGNITKFMLKVNIILI